MKLPAFDLANESLKTTLPLGGGENGVLTDWVIIPKVLMMSVANLLRMQSRVFVPLLAPPQRSAVDTLNQPAYGSLEAPPGAAT